MPITLTEDEMDALLSHLRLESRVAFYRDELEDVQDDPDMFGDDEHSEEDRARAEEDAQDLYDDADAALQNSTYHPPDAFDGTPLFHNLCTQADIRTGAECAPLSKAQLRSIVEEYLKETSAAVGSA
jgi:glycosyltransferase involved in cell wall biosynthesis